MSTIAFSKYFDIFTLVKCLEGYKSLVQVLAIIFLCLTMSLSLSFLVRSFLTLISRVTRLLDCYLDIKICGSAFNRGHLMGGKATFRAKKCKSTFYIHLHLTIQVYQRLLLETMLVNIRTMLSPRRCLL